MEKMMSHAQIKKRFKSEWVLLSDPKVARNQILGGRVVFHSKDRDKVYQKAIDLKLKHSATLYTGKMPKDMAIIL